MTASLIRCLLAVLALSDTFERVASKDVAHLLGVRKPTIHNTLLALQERGLIDKERLHHVCVCSRIFAFLPVRSRYSHVDKPLQRRRTKP